MDDRSLSLGRFYKTVAQVVLFFFTLQLAAPAFAARTTTFYHPDARGDVVAASDEEGNLLWRKTYTPYGNVELKPADGADPERVEQSKEGFTGKQHDSGTGLVYFGARYYDPELGRFISKDPAGVLGNVENNPMMFNRYAYANNNPYKFTDPNGESPTLVEVAVIGLVIYVGAALLPTLYTNPAHRSGGFSTSSPSSLPFLDPPSGAREGSPIIEQLLPWVFASPNDGNAKKHGGQAHDDALNDRIDDLKNDPSVSNIRKNQRQVDANGNEVGLNRPDIQYDQGGCHYCIEYDNVPKNSQQHGTTIRANDPNAKVELKLLK